MVQGNGVGLRVGGRVGERGQGAPRGTARGITEERGFDVGGGEGTAGTHDLAGGVHPHGEYLAGPDVLPIRDHRPCHAPRPALACPRRGPGWRRAAPRPRSIAGAGDRGGLAVPRAPATRPSLPSARL